MKNWRDVECSQRTNGQPRPKFPAFFEPKLGNYICLVHVFSELIYGKTQRPWEKDQRLLAKSGTFKLETGLQISLLG